MWLKNNTLLPHFRIRLKAIDGEIFQIILETGFMGRWSLQLWKLTVNRGFRVPKRRKYGTNNAIKILVGDIFWQSYEFLGVPYFFGKNNKKKGRKHGT